MSETTQKTTAPAINTLLYPNSTKGETRMVWVAGTESLTSGSFDWFYEEQDAKDFFEKDKPFSLKVANTQCHLFKFEVEANLTRDEITQEVDDFYAEHSRSKAFNENEAIIGFPYTPEAFLLMITLSEADNA